MLRGVQDNFYYVLKDDISKDGEKFYLIRLKLELNNDGRFERKTKTVCSTGEIFVFEMDSSITNDVESVYHDYDTPHERKGKLDRIFLIDGYLNLIKYEMGDQVCKKLSEVSLKKFDNIKKMIESYLKDNFLKISVTDRCLTIQG